jgi:hypothetical protein
LAQLSIEPDAGAGAVHTITLIRFTFRAREVIVTLSLGGHLGTRMSRTLVLPGLILVAVGLPWRWSGPLRLGRLPGDIVVERVHS